jgi:hypothetical protein
MIFLLPAQAVPVITNAKTSITRVNFFFANMAVCSFGILFINDATVAR